MKKENKKQALREMKALSLSLYELYLAQASEKITEMNSYHENGHDNSGGHPDYHCNQHCPYFHRHVFGRSCQWQALCISLYSFIPHSLYPEIFQSPL